MTFVHLHCHTHYSLLDGLPKPAHYVEKAVKDGSPAVAITDHGNLYGAIEFYKAAKKADVKPIIGIEVYTAPGSRFSKQSGVDNQLGHLVLLAKNKQGYENLSEIATKAHLEGFYYKPRVDRELLKEYSKDLILMTGCLQGEIAQSLLANNEEQAQKFLKEYQDIFGKENVYLEVQSHPQMMEQGIVNEKLKKLSSANGAQLVATNDCHYVNLEDKEAHGILLCVQTGTTVHDENRFQMEGEFDLKSPEEMKQAFHDMPEAIENTLQIAEQCNVELSIDEKNLLPSFDPPFNKTPKDYLFELCKEGMKERYGDNPSQEILDRLDYELGLVHTMGFDTYFLIVHDFVAFAKNSGILVGPGRGSGAGSIIAYCLRITDVDPMKYKLIFERFLNPERVSMPDFDIDFADNRRDEVLEYVVGKYGKDRVAQIITFGTMAARAAVRDVGRALGMTYGEVDVIAKLIPARPGIKLEEAMEQEQELKAQYDSNPQIKKLLDLAGKMEGVVRHASVHACAVVIGDQSLVKYTPLQYAPGGQEESVITQYDMYSVEALGLLKMDFLGLKNLTIMQYALEIIKRTKDVDIDLDDLPLDDKETFKLMARGDTTGVFQFESAGMKRYMKQLKPTRFEDLIAMNALYRPGPMDWIPSYIKGKHNPKSVKYLHDSFKEILEETHGVAVYQEQILQLARLVAGFSLGEADILRKAVGKKIAELLAQQRTKFIEGAINEGHTEKFAVEVFDKVIEPFAGYGFNKAHATCYALIAYRTAYLKSHYPAEFMAALMTSDRDNTDRLIIEFNEAEAMGIHVLPPSINESMANFTVVDDDTVRFGLAAVKGVGIGTVDEILDVRSKGGPFKDVEDLAKRVPYNLLNKKTLEALAYSGALDDLGDRKALVASIEDISRHARHIQTTSAQGQTDIFSMMDDGDDSFPAFVLADVPEASHLQKLQWEKEFLGFYISGHPLQGLRKYLRQKVNLIEALSKKDVGRMVKVVGIITQLKKITTKTGSQMCYFTIEDPTGRMEVTVFPNTFTKFRELFTAESVVSLTGKVELRRGQFQILCQNIQGISLETMISKARKSKLYDPKEKMRILEATPEDEEIPEPSPSEVPKGATGDAAPPPPAPSAEATELDEDLVIKLNDPQTSSDRLLKLKELLLRHQGKRHVEIHIAQEGMLKRIKVPFGVKVTPDLKSKISELATLED